MTARELTRCRAQYSPESPECGNPMPCLTHYPDPPARPAQPSLAAGLDAHRFRGFGMFALLLALLLPACASAATSDQPIASEFRCGVHVTFQRHPPASVTSGPWALMIVGETDRRGGERTVIVERFNGQRETAATWDAFAERWRTPDNELWEDVRARAVCETVQTPRLSAERAR